MTPKQPFLAGIVKIARRMIGAGAENAQAKYRKPSGTPVMIIANTQPTINQDKT